MRRTLVDLIRNDILRTDDLGPDWPEVVEDAVLRQDLEWLGAAYRVDLAGDQELGVGSADGLDAGTLAWL